MTEEQINPAPAQDDASPAETLEPPAQAVADRAGERAHEHLFDDAGVPLVAQLQALLFISDEALTEERLAAAVGRAVAEVRAGLAALQTRLADPESGIVLRELASGWRLTTAAECAPLLERYVVDGHSSRLSPAALETLAVVAYQQPVSRGRIAAIRGVGVDGVVRTLLARGLIEEAGTEASGAIVYATTPLFMDKLGVKTLSELPSLAPLLPDIETIDGVYDQPSGGLVGEAAAPASEAEEAPQGDVVLSDLAELADLGDRVDGDDDLAHPGAPGPAASNDLGGAIPAENDDDAADLPVAENEGDA